MTVGQPASVQDPCRRRGNEFDRIETGINELDEVSLLLDHPVAPGKPDVPAADVEHLDDVLWLEKLGIEIRQRNRRPVVAGAGDAPRADVNAGILEEGMDIVLHAALGETEADDGGGRHGR